MRIYVNGKVYLVYSEIGLANFIMAFNRQIGWMLECFQVE